MASLDKTKQPWEPKQREGWNTHVYDDTTPDGDSEGSSEWLIASPTTTTTTTFTPPSRFYHINPIKKFQFIPRGRRRSVLRLVRSRPLHRLGCLLLLLAGVQAYLLHQDYINALAAKFSPTSFTHLSTLDEQRLAEPRWRFWKGAEPEDDEESSSATRQTDGPSKQVQWKKLGSGYEGDTFAFNGTVIKVFKPERSPLRNCVPQTTSSLAWPPEIPVSLLLGGSVAGWSQAATAAIPADDAHFVPILDYFFLQSTAQADDARKESNGEWHLITPFLSSGTLDHLAKRLRHHEPVLSTSEIDAHFRPSFHHILEALDIMHSQNDLCHDDVKMDNIFVMDFSSSSSSSSSSSTETAVLPAGKDVHWLLGDLGNAREPAHPYHASLLWSHDNSQHSDCRLNDLLRLVKSYVLFLQAATKASSPEQRDAFASSFLEGSAPWSRLYWYAMNKVRYNGGKMDGATAARHILDVSSSVFPPAARVHAEGEEGEEEATLLDSLSSSSSSGSKSGVGLDDKEQIHRLVQPSLEKAWFDHAWLGIDKRSRRIWSVSRELGSGMGLSEKWAKIFGTWGILPTPVGRRRC